MTSLRSEKQYMQSLIELQVIKEMIAAAANLDSTIVVQTLNAGNNSITHGFGSSKRVVDFIVRDGDTLHRLVGDVVDVDTFNVFLGSGTITNAEIEFIHKI